jgi:hypothetical protein
VGLRSKQKEVAITIDSILNYQRRTKVTTIFSIIENISTIISEGNMRKLSMMLITMMILVLILAVLPVAAASPPVDVMIEADEYITAPGNFLASGPAVSDGLICGSGATIDQSIKGQSGKNLQVVKEFICDDGSGTFLVKLQVKFDNAGFTNFKWNIVGGTGDYGSLRGNGSGVGFPASGDYDILDVYDGKVH